MQTKIMPRINITTVPNLLKNFLTCFFKGEVFIGTAIKKFEAEFAKYCGVKNAISVSSGRDGMRLILKSLNLKKKDEIIFPAYTLVDLPLIGKEMGLKPVFVDVDLKTFNIIPNLIEEKITKRTKVIIATHLFGLPCDIEKIIKVAERHKLIVIEDCAHSVGAEFERKKVGSFGTAAIFSFELRKPINTLGGGMITTNDNELATKVKTRLESNYSYKIIFKKLFIYFLERFLLNTILYTPIAYLLHSKFKEKVIAFYQKYHTHSKSSRFNFTNFQAILGIEQLKNLDLSNERRIKAAKVLTRLLEKNNLLFLPRSTRNSKHIYYSYAITSKYDGDSISQKLFKLGIDTAIGNEIMQNCPKKLGIKERFPNTEMIIKTAIQLPFHNEISEKDIQLIHTALNKL